MPKKITPSKGIASKAEVSKKPITKPVTTAVRNTPIPKIGALVQREVTHEMISLRANKDSSLRKRWRPNAQLAPGRARIAAHADRPESMRSEPPRDRLHGCVGKNDGRLQLLHGRRMIFLTVAHLEHGPPCLYFHCPMWCSSRAVLPWQIFEERYKTMTERCPRWARPHCHGAAPAGLGEKLLPSAGDRAGRLPRGNSHARAARRWEIYFPAARRCPSQNHQRATR